MNRRSFLKKTIGGVLATSILSGSAYYYARYIEPFNLSISEHDILSGKIPQTFHNFKIVHFSDTHIGFHFDLTRVQSLIDKINNFSPDLIVFTGDLLDQPDTFTDYRQLPSILRQLQAPFGKYWVYGNHDHGGYGTKLVNSIMENSGFILLKNDYEFINIKNNRILLSGVDDAILGTPNIEKALPTQLKNPLFTILLAHEPDFADTASQFPIDIQLSGHSHGGQVRLPFIGHLYTPIFAEKYVSGKYDLKDGDLSLFVNRGIGTTRLPLRFLCTPELSIYTLKHKAR